MSQYFESLRAACIIAAAATAVMLSVSMREPGELKVTVDQSGAWLRAAVLSF